MFVQLWDDHNKKFDVDNPSTSAAPAVAGEESGGSSDPSVPDDWVLRGERLIRRHFNPRSTLFSPMEWQREHAKAGMTAQPVVELPNKEDEERFKMIKLEHLEVWRETRPDQESFDEHWGTWCADEKNDAEPPSNTISL